MSAMLRYVFAALGVAAASAAQAEIVQGFEVTAWTYQYAHARSGSLSVTARDSAGRSVVVTIAGMAAPRDPGSPAVVGAGRVTGFPLPASGNARVSFADPENACARTDLCGGLGALGAHPFPIDSHFPSGATLDAPYTAPFSIRGSVPVTRLTGPVVPIVGTFEFQGTAGEANFRPDTIAGWSVTARGTSGRLLVRSAARMTIVNAASFASGPVAADAFFAAFVPGLSAVPVAARTPECHRELGGYRLVLSAFDLDDEPAVCLTYVGSGQVNFRAPAEIRPGLSLRFELVRVTGERATIADGVASSVASGRIAPGIFTQSADGKGLPAGNLLRIDAGGEPVYGPVPAEGIALATDDREIFLVLYGTGIRGRAAQGDVTASWEGIPFEVLYAAAQPSLPGVDQINLRIPRDAVAASGVRAGLLRMSVKSGSTTLNANPVELRFADSAK